jgi:hypothetical protein
MMLKRWCWSAVLIVAASLMMAQAAKADSQPTFREENGLQAYESACVVLKGVFHCP